MKAKIFFLTLLGFSLLGCERSVQPDIYESEITVSDFSKIQVLELPYKKERISEIQPTAFGTVDQHVIATFYLENAQRRQIKLVGSVIPKGTHDGTSLTGGINPAKDSTLTGYKLFLELEPTRPATKGDLRIRYTLY